MGKKKRLSQSGSTVRPHCISTLADTLLLTHTSAVCVCVRAHAKPLSRHLISSPELSWCLPRSIPGLQYHPSYIQQCLRHGPFFLFVLSPFILHPVKQLNFIKGAEHHDNLYYQPTHQVFIGRLSLCFYFFYFSHSSVSLCIILLLSPSPLPFSPASSLYLPITDESISRVIDAERVQ